MSEYIKDLFSNRESSVNLKSFNTVQMVFIIGLTLMTGIIYVCIDDVFYTYLTLIYAMLFVVNYIDANRSGNIKRCAITMSLLFNLVYFPFCFFGFDKLICVVPMYFILGLLYTGLLVEGKTGMVISIVEIVVMAFIIFRYGKYVQLTPPGEETYIEILAVCAAVVIVGILAAVAVKYRIIQYNEEHKKVEDIHLKVIDAYNQKDIFLANTSHEIRTPLNAIVGTVNMLLDSDLDTYVRENIYSILNSCNALLSITDELMDLSNTENKSMDIVNRKYDFSEMLIEIINMMSVRLMESDVDLYVDIDKNTPRNLVGDSVKVRQVFINILNNAVKYTKSGRITLRVKSQISNSGFAKIMVEVEDTGIGIKPENLSKLFEFYKRDDDSSETRNIEGTGIGLNLCKEIIEKMGGNISVKSEYHIGSTFYFDFTQEIESGAKMTDLDDPRKYRVLIFERNEELSTSLKWVMSNLSVTSEIASSRMEFESLILSEKFNYIFIGYEKYIENKRFIDRKLKDERLIIISDITQSVSISQNGYLLSRPVYTLNSALALQNKSSNHVREIIKKGGFKCPDTTILVVDDNLTNLEVARGLLSKYDGRIITALSGKEALHILKEEDVDLIFLDYMMPEMNGIDTLYNIRAMDNPKMKDIPVIALTANVVNGAREMFLEAGFDDYIAKPINVNKLEKVLITFINREKIILNNDDN